MFELMRRKPQRLPSPEATPNTGLISDALDEIRDELRAEITQLRADRKRLTHDNLLLQDRIKALEGDPSPSAAAKLDAKVRALTIERDFWVDQGRELQNQLQTWQRMYAGLYDQLGRGVVTDQSLAENLALASEELRQPIASVEAIRAMTAMLKDDTQGAYTRLDRSPSSIAGRLTSDKDSSPKPLEKPVPAKSAVYEIAKQHFKIGTLDWVGDQIAVLLVGPEYQPDFDKDEFLSSIPAAARIASAGVYGRRVKGGYAKAITTRVQDMPIDRSVSAMVLYRDGGSPEQSRLIAFISEGAGMPVQTNGGDVEITWDETIFPIPPLAPRKAERALSPTL